MTLWRAENYCCRLLWGALTKCIIPETPKYSLEKTQKVKPACTWAFELTDIIFTACGYFQLFQTRNQLFLFSSIFVCVESLSSDSFVIILRGFIVPQWWKWTTKHFLTILQRKVNECWVLLLLYWFACFFSFAVLFFGCFTIFDTIHDTVSRTRGEKLKKSSKIFSLWSNFEELCKINRSSSIINSVDGIKVLCALWIVLGHRNERIPKPDSVVHSMIWKFLWEFFDSVTTFLVCSAIVVTQSILRALDR